MEPVTTLCTGAVSLAATGGQHHLLGSGAWASLTRGPLGQAGSDAAGMWQKVPGHRSWGYLLMGLQEKWHRWSVHRGQDSLLPCHVKDSDNEGAPPTPSWHSSCVCHKPPRDKTNQGAAICPPFTCPFQTQPRLPFFAQDRMCCLSPRLLFTCLPSLSITNQTTFT